MRVLRLLILFLLPLISYGQATPVVVADICPGGCSSNPSNLVEWNGKVYFFATSPTAGRELHVYDGTSVSVVADITSGIGDGVRSNSALALLSNNLYFAANDTSGATQHYVYAYNGVATPQKIALANGDPLASRGALAASGSNLLMEYNDSAWRYRLANFIPSSGTIQIIGQGYFAQYVSISDLQVSGGIATYGGAIGPPNAVTARAFACDLGSGTIASTPTLYTGRVRMGPDGAYLPYTDINPGTGANNGTHLSRFKTAPFSWSMLTSGPLSVLRPADRSQPALLNNHIYYPALTTPSNSTNNEPLSFHRYEPNTGTTTVIMPLPTAAVSSEIIRASAALSGVLYLNYNSQADGPELFAYTGGTNFIRITEIDGPTAGFNPTQILSFNGDLLIAGTTSANGTELYRITGTGLGLTDAQEKSAAILSPNPASTQLTITLPKAGRHILRILSTTGQILRTQTIEGVSSTISVEDLAAGFYFAHITDANTGAAVGSARFVKE